MPDEDCSVTPFIGRLWKDIGSARGLAGLSIHTCELTMTRQFPHPAHF